MSRLTRLDAVRCATCGEPIQLVQNGPTDDPDARYRLECTADPTHVAAVPPSEEGAP